MDAPTRENAQLETNTLRNVKPMELATDGVRNRDFFEAVGG